MPLSVTEIAAQLMTPGAPQYIYDPETNREWSLGPGGNTLRYASRQGVPLPLEGGGYRIVPQQTGTTAQFYRTPGGGFDFDSPYAEANAGRPGFLPTRRLSQTELVRQAERVTPPGVRSVLAGERPETFDPFGGRAPGFQIPTPGLYSSLTGDEQAAYGSRLAAQNLSAGDVEFAVRQRFGNTRRRRAARQAF